MPSHIAFFISDSTGITAETIGYSLIAQFPDLKFNNTTIAYIESEEQANNVLKKIEESAKKSKLPVLIFSTLADPKLREIISKAKGVFLDCFNAFLPKIENALKEKSAQTIGQYHAIKNKHRHASRIENIHFTLETDDGNRTEHYPDADLILMGASRSGKTPVCLYLAMHFGLRAANYPLTEEDLAKPELPKAIASYQEKLFGLTVDPTSLSEMRKNRYQNSQYASSAQCEKEIEKSEDLFKRYKIPFLNTTDFSVEEISTKILHTLKLKRHPM